MSKILLAPRLHACRVDGQPQWLHDLFNTMQLFICTMLEHVRALRCDYSRGREPLVEWTMQHDNYIRVAIKSSKHSSVHLAPVLAFLWPLLAYCLAHTMWPQHGPTLAWKRIWAMARPSPGPDMGPKLVWSTIGLSLEIGQLRPGAGLAPSGWADRSAQSRMVC